MSYLALPRLAFAGRFLSDVSTRNNLPENFQPGEPTTNLWNPVGGATFEFLDCEVSGALADDDPLVGARLTGLADRSSGKMVDLDPEWQMASELWGLGVRVFDPITGELGFQGEFLVAAFRDLWQRQISDLRRRVLQNGQPSGARYVSVLTGVEWGPLAERSPTLRALRNATQEDRLGIGFHQFGYFYTEAHPRHSTGSCVGAIGPYHSGEPETAIIARRIMPLAVPNLLPNPNEGGALTAPGKIIDAIDFVVDRNLVTASFDIGHALPLDGVDGPLSDLSSIYPPFEQLAGLRLGLRPPDSVRPLTLLSPADVSLLTERLDLSGDWYIRSGGVLDVRLEEGEAKALESSRVGVFGELGDGSLTLLAEETEGGVFARADRFVLRLEPEETAGVKIFARRFGLPASGADLFLGRPAAAGLSVSEKVTTETNGSVNVDLVATDPGNPRGPLDGQVFPLAYSFKADAAGAPDRTGTGLGGLDVIVIHVRDRFDIPDHVDFDTHIGPIMEQYDQLYPIMSAHLFRLADREMFLRYRQPLLTAFRLPIDHPNHMPVSRDLSAPKTKMIVQWLEEQSSSARSAGKANLPPPSALTPFDPARFVAAFDAADRDAKTVASDLLTEELDATVRVPDLVAAEKK